MRNTLLVIHILAAASWIGANMAQIVVKPWMVKQGGAVAAAWMRGTVRMGRLLYTPAAVVILVTGIWMVSISAVYEFENLFVVIGFLAVLVGGLLGSLVFGPGGEQAAKLYESGDGGGPLRVLTNRLAVFGALDTAVLVVAVISMVGRWGL